MERTTEQDAKYMIKYKPRAYFEYRLYKKGWFGRWWCIRESWFRDVVIRAMLEDNTAHEPEYYK